MSKKILLPLFFVLSLTSCSVWLPKTTDTPPPNQERIGSVELEIAPAGTYTVVRDFGTSDEEADKFPKPKKIVLAPSNWPDIKPFSNNASDIFLASTDNSSLDITHVRDYKLVGKVSVSIQTLEIIQGDTSTSRFIPVVQGDFTMTLSDMKSGKNIYLLRAYSRNNTVYEKIFTLYYYTIKKEDEAFQKRDTLPESEDSYEQCGPYFISKISENGQQEWLFMPNQYGENTQRLPLIGGINFLYSQKSIAGERVGEIRFENANTAKKYGPYPLTLGCGSFQTHTLKKIAPDEYLLITSAGHEGESMEYYFNARTGIFLDIMGLMKSIDGNAAYPIFSVDVDDKNIILTEHKYCCDDIFSLYGLEKIYFSKDGKFIKRTTIEKPPLFGRSVKTAKVLYLTSKEYWYNFFSGDHPVTNPAVIDAFLVEHPECFEEENGFICDLIYEFEIDEKWNARVVNIAKNN